MDGGGVGLAGLTMGTRGIVTARPAFNLPCMIQNVVYSYTVYLFEVPRVMRPLFDAPPLSGDALDPHGLPLEPIEDDVMMRETGVRRAVEVGAGNG